MIETPLLDDLAALGDAGTRLLAACEAVVDQAREELAALEREERRKLLDSRVALFFMECPDASANRVADELGGTRAEVLAAVRRLRTGSVDLRTAEEAA